MIHLIALQIAADTSPDTVWQWRHSAGRLQMSSSMSYDGTFPAQMTLLHGNLGLHNRLDTTPSRGRKSRNPARLPSNTHSISGAS